MEETLKRLKRYINEEAGGDRVLLDGVHAVDTYTWVDANWSSPEEATIEYKLACAPDHEMSFDLSYSTRLKDICLDTIRVTEGRWGEKRENTYYVLSWEAPKGVLGDNIVFRKEESAKKACEAIRHAARLAGAQAKPAGGPPIARAQDAAATTSPAGAKDDGPDMKETLKWIKQYLDMDAGGQIGPKWYAKYASGPDLLETPSSPKDAIVSWCINNTVADFVNQDFLSLKLCDLDPDRITVKPSLLPAGCYDLYLATAGGRKLITFRSTSSVGEHTDSIHDCSITFLNEESAKKACRAFRHAALLAGAHADAKDVDPFAPDPKTPPTGSNPPAAAGKQPSARERQRRDVEKQISALEAQLPAARREDAGNREYNRAKRDELEANVKALDQKGTALLQQGKIVEAAAVTALQETAKRMVDDSSNYKDDKHEDRLLKQIADLKQQLIDLRD